MATGAKYGGHARGAALLTDGIAASERGHLGASVATFDAALDALGAAYAPEADPATTAGPQASAAPPSTTGSPPGSCSL